MRTPMVIYGAGGLGREVGQAVKASPELTLAGFIDDGKPPGAEVHGLPVFGGFDAIADLPPGHDIFIAIGSIPVHKALVARIEALGRAFAFGNVIHPAAVIDRDNATLGRGNYIGAGTVLTADVVIGDWNLINVNCVLAHDVVLGERCQVNPGAVINGQTVLGNDVVIGTGAVLMPRVRVEDGATIGAGAVLTRKRVRAGMTMLGNPATPFRRAR